MFQFIFILELPYFLDTEKIWCATHSSRLQVNCHVSFEQRIITLSIVAFFSFLPRAAISNKHSVLTQ
jgi:hypothetical protein